jgi:MFS family permease
MGGLVFAGIAIGPVLGGYVISLTGNVLTPFYTSVVVCFVIVCAIIFLLPESHSKERQLGAREKHATKRELRKASRDEDVRESGDSFWRWSVTRVRHGAASLVAFARPMAMLLPQRRPVEDIDESAGSGSTTTTRKGKLDWNLTFVALAAALYSLMIVSARLGPQCVASLASWTDFACIGIVQYENPVHPVQIRLGSRTSWRTCLKENPCVQRRFI